MLTFVPFAFGNKNLQVNMIQLFGKWTGLSAALAALTLLPLSCRSGEEEAPATRPARVEETQAATSRKAGQVIIDATLEQQPDSKTALNGDRRVIWSSGDQIRVFNASHPDGVVFTLLEESAGTVKGKFSGDAPGGDGPFYAVYPASSAVRLNNGNLRIDLPASQTAVAGSFGENASLSVACSSALSNLDFHNVLGAISFTVNGSKKIARIEVESNEALTGTGVITVDAEGVPALTMTATGAAAKKAVLDCSASQDHTFLLMLPPGTLKKGFTATLYDTDGNLAFKGTSSTNNTIVRSSIVNMPAFQYQAQYNGAFFAFEGFGLVDGVQAGGHLDTAQAFSDAPSQYAVSVGSGKRTLRVQNWAESRVMTLTTDNSLTVGNTYQVTVDLLEGTSRTTRTLPFTLVKTTAEAAWFTSEDGKQGLILPLED